MLRNENFPAFEHPYNLFEYFQIKGTHSNNLVETPEYKWIYRRTTQQRKHKIIFLLPKKEKRY